ncbi:TetR family transcriptional regulator [Ktedonobacter sp. SOSP1-85]|uniref:TetR/AcrR family transcriptional regulator n=1 Tax=Ktedonobacter sp. SOSP1-85 TaxID=2778367 RepID=UPI001916A8D6|nr:TetR/AcrR family transcriptional regulator [Ktedonobacter sp. SOSP1-85]GHO78896.1 TetR family transcriptional regulator [Ktedonobacter sp. SOSP1-85]
MTQKLETTEDLRVRRTRKLLQQAFIELTVEKGFATLTVRDITERAMVNRSTFYRHYLDKYDLLEQYMNEIYELTEDQNFPAEKQEQASPGPLNLLKHIQQYADFYRVMLSAKGDPHFTQRFRQNTEKRFRSFSTQTPTEPEADAPQIDLRLSCIAYAGIGATTWWLEQEQPCPPEQLARWMSQISSAIAGPSLKP